MFKHDVVRKAFDFAITHHGSQVYANIHPYVIHLHDVMMVLVEFGIHDPDLLASAWLHDVIEDTACNYHDVENEFGTKIADIVYVLTDELGKNRKERKVKTLPKLNNFVEAQVVKLADWIANVRQCHRNSHKMYQMYKKDFQFFRDLKNQSLGHPLMRGNMLTMWEELESLLSNDIKEFMRGINTYHPEFDNE